MGNGDGLQKRRPMRSCTGPKECGPLPVFYRPVISVTRWMHGMDGSLTDNDDGFLLYGENVK